LIVIVTSLQLQRYLLLVLLVWEEFLQDGQYVDYRFRNSDWKRSVIDRVVAVCGETKEDIHPL
jgi:hypothetical protein